MNNVVRFSGRQYRALHRLIDGRVRMTPKHPWYQDGCIYSMSPYGVWLRYAFDHPPFEGRFVLPPLPYGQELNSRFNSYNLHEDILEMVDRDGVSKAISNTLRWQEYSLFQHKFSPVSAIATSASVSIDTRVLPKVLDVIEAFGTKSLRVGTLKLDGIDTIMVSAENYEEEDAVLTMIIQERKVRQ